MAQPNQRVSCALPLKGTETARARPPSEALAIRTIAQREYLVHAKRHRLPPVGQTVCPASQRGAAPTGLRSEERATREGGAVKGEWGGGWGPGGEREGRAA